VILRDYVKTICELTKHLKYVETETGWFVGRKDLDVTQLHSASTEAGYWGFIGPFITELNIKSINATNNDTQGEMSVLENCFDRVAKKLKSKTILGAIADATDWGPPDYGKSILL